MRLSVNGLALASALVWGGLLFLVGLINLVVPTYGAAFLQLMSSVYPGFHASHSYVAVLVGTGFGLVDGAVCGLLFGSLYNLCVHGREARE